MIGWGSDCAYFPSGFGTQTCGILKSISDIYNVYNIAWQHFGKPILFENFKILPGGPEYNTQYYGSVSMPQFMKERKPDLVCTLSDIQVLEYMPRAKLESKSKWLAYFPIDTHDWKREWVKLVKKCDYPVTYSKFGHNLLESKHVETKMIYHGIDTDIYKPYPAVNRATIKAQLADGKETFPLKEKFVVGGVFRMNPRKMPERWLVAFKEFAKDKDDVVGYLHTDPSDPMATCKLYEWIDALRIKKKILITQGYHWWKGIDSRVLALIMNCMDVHFLPTGGEGFGLPIIETMACGVPNVTTDYTTGPEFLIGKGGKPRGELIKVQEYVIQRGCERPWIDIEDAVECLNAIYYDENLRKTYADRCIKFAKQFCWDKIGKKWLRYLGSIV